MVNIDISGMEEIVRALKGGKTLTELFDIVKLSRTELTPLINWLVKEGYVGEVEPENSPEPVYILFKDMEQIIKELRQKGEK